MADWDSGSKIKERYEILSHLSEGGMGTVFRALDQKTGVECVIKRLRPGLSRSELLRERFRREALIPAAVAHPGVVRVTDVDVTGTGELYLVMDFVDGRTLRACIREGRFALAMTRNIGLEVLDIMRVAHGAGIVHRDLTPANVIMSNAGSIRIIDWGIAKVLDELDHDRAPLTATGALLGTLQYMSLEQLCDPRGVDHRADLWAVGVILFELVTGKLPYTADRLDALLFQMISNGSLGWHDILERVIDDALVIEFFRRALSVDRSQRFSSAGEMAAALTVISDRPHHFASNAASRAASEPSPRPPAMSKSALDEFLHRAVGAGRRFQSHDEIFDALRAAHAADNKVQVKSFEQPLCLLLVPERSDPAVATMVAKAAGSAGARYQRLAEIGDGVASSRGELDSADFFVCEVTGNDGFILSSIGYAMAVGKSTILITAGSVRDLPVTLQDQIILKYQRDPQELERQELERQLFNIMKRFVVEHDRPEQFLKQLQITVPMRGRQGQLERMRRSSDPIVRYLVEYPLTRYIRAVHRAQRDELPMASSDRLQVAISAIDQAQGEIRAINVVGGDPWHGPESDYFHSNCAAASRGVAIRRILLITDEDSISPELDDILGKYREVGIGLRFGRFADMQAHLLAIREHEFVLENLLIIDNALMTRSGGSSHDGVVHASPRTIGAAARTFDELWTHGSLSADWPERRRAVRRDSADIDVLVVGAGAVGTNAALFMSRFGLDVQLIDSAPCILDGAPRATFIAHADGLEYYKKEDHRTGMECIDGAFVKGLIYPLHEIATRVCDDEHPTRFLVSRKSVKSGAVRLDDFFSNATMMRGHYKAQFRRIQSARGWNEREMVDRFLRSPTSSFYRLDPVMYEDVKGIAGGCAGASFGVNMPRYYALLQSALERSHVDCKLATQIEKIERCGDHHRVHMGGRAITTRQILLAAGHRLPSIVNIMGDAARPWLRGRFYLRAMTMVVLPRTNDSGTIEDARRITFTLQGAHGGMFACIVPPSANEDGIAAIYWPSPHGCHLFDREMGPHAPEPFPAEWDNYIAQGLDSDDPRVTRTLDHLRGVYRVLRDARISHTVCRATFVAASDGDPRATELRMRMISQRSWSSPDDANITMCAAPKWTSAELVALIVTNDIYKRLRQKPLHARRGMQFGPTGMDVPEELDLSGTPIPREYAENYARAMGLPIHLAEEPERKKRA